MRWFQTPNYCKQKQRRSDTFHFVLIKSEIVLQELHLFALEACCISDDSNAVVLVSNRMEHSKDRPSLGKDLWGQIFGFLAGYQLQDEKSSIMS